jgi:hypothetical protein
MKPEGFERMVHTLRREHYTRSGSEWVIDYKGIARIIGSTQVGVRNAIIGNRPTTRRDIAEKLTGLVGLSLYDVYDDEDLTAPRQTTKRVNEQSN